MAAGPLVAAREAGNRWGREGARGKGVQGERRAVADEETIN